MTFRITRKLAKKIHVNPAISLPTVVNPFLDWTAHLFMASRWQFIMITNSRCLYSIVMLGKGITNKDAFVKLALMSLRDYMELDGISSIYYSQIMPYADEITFSKTNDRRILGSMNDLIKQAKVYMLDLGLPLSLVNLRVNDTPMSLLNFRNPKEALFELVKP